MIYRYVGGAALLALGLTTLAVIAIPAQLIGILLIIGAIGLLAGI